MRAWCFGAGLTRSAKKGSDQEMKNSRIIGEFTGAEPGPVLICLAGVHGNEKAGVQALETIFSLPEFHPENEHALPIRGRIIGILGNLQAIERHERFVHRDLNRIWGSSEVERVKQTPISLLEGEDKELRELVDLIEYEIENNKPEKSVILDLHTTSAKGGIFTVPAEDEESVQLGVRLHAPVIKGMMNGIKGSSLSYFRDGHLNATVLGMAFEAGQHDDPISVNRSIAAVTNCLIAIGAVNRDAVKNQNDQILKEYSRGLPRIAELVYHHVIQPNDDFTMAPGYHNFQRVTKGELLATDRHGPILAPLDAHILMPHYQKQGNDGFFLIKECAS